MAKTLTEYAGTSTGSGGAPVGNATPQPLGVAVAGISASASHEDHVHTLPTAAQVGALAVTEKGAANGVAQLGADQKVPISQIPASLVGALNYQGTWNAATNSPPIPTAAAGNKGHYYKVSTAGSTPISGIADWAVGDFVLSNGTAWDKVDNTDPMIVNNLTAGGTGAALSAEQGKVLKAQVDAKATLNAPISLAAATSLTAALHGNRQVLFNGPSANLTVQSDAAGGTANDDEFQVVTEDASAGVPTLVLPDASTLVGGKDVIMGAVRKGANLWRKYMIPEGIFGALRRGLVPAADATPDGNKVLTQTGWATNIAVGQRVMGGSAIGMFLPGTLGIATFNALGLPSPSMLGGSTAGTGAAVTDPAGHRPRVRISSASPAVSNRVAGLGLSAPVHLASSGSPINGRFPWTFQSGVSDTNSGSFFMGFTTAPNPDFAATEPSAWSGDILGLACNSTGANSTNLFLIHNDNTDSPTLVDLGASFPKTQGQIYQLHLEKNNGGTSYTATVTKLGNGVDDVVSDPIVLNTNLPRTTVAMYPNVARSSMASAAAVSVDFAGIFCGRFTA